MKIGYVRVSTSEQNTLRQEVMMKELGVDAIYIDKMSGKNTNRPQLNAVFYTMALQQGLSAGIINPSSALL